MDTLVCRTCGKELPVESFEIRNRQTGTRRRSCRECVRLSAERRRHARRPKHVCRLCGSEFTKDGRIASPLCDVCRDTHKWCPKCDRVLPASSFSPDATVNAGVRSFCRSCCSAQAAGWSRMNRHKANATVRARRANNPQYRLTANMGNAMYQSLRDGKAKRSWQELVPYTLDALRRRLESQFTEGMSWENYGEWHVDHIVPKTWFDYESSDDWQFQVCWSLANLQPLWGEVNVRKGNRYAA